MNIEEGGVFRDIKDVRVAEGGSQQLEGEGTKLKQRKDLKQFVNVEIKEAKFGSFESDNIKS